MKRIITVFVLALSLIFTLHAQAPTLDWVNAVHSPDSESARAVASDRTSGEVYVAGKWDGSLAGFFPPPTSEMTNFSATAGGTDGLVVKLDPGGNVIWAFSIGSGGDDQITDIHVDETGHFYVCGDISAGEASFEGAGPIDFNFKILLSGSNRAFLAKFDPEGVPVWFRLAGGDGQSIAKGISTGPDGVYLVGEHLDGISFGILPPYLSKGGWDAFTVKYAPVGDEMWFVSTGSTDNEYAEVVASNGMDLYLAGRYNGGALEYRDPGATTISSGIDAAGNGYDVFLTCLTSEGFPRWTQSISSASYDNCEGMDLDSDHIYLAGSMKGDASFPMYSANPVPVRGTKDLYVCSIRRTDGGTRWVRTLSGSAISEVLPKDLSLGLDKMLYVTGYFSEEVVTADSTLVSKGLQDIIMAAYTMDGDETWIKTAGSAGSDRGFGVCARAPGRLYMAGSYAEDLDFGGQQLPGDGNDNLFLASMILGCTGIQGGTLTVSDTVVTDGEAFSLILKDYLGDIRWQYSLPGLNNWSLLTADMSDSIQVVPGATADYRAYVTSADCPSDSSSVVRVEVIKDCSDITAGFLTASDTVVTEGDAFTLFLKDYKGDISWEYLPMGASDWLLLSADLSDSIQVFPTGTADYRALVSILDCPHVSSNVVHVEVKNPNIRFADAGEDVTICPGDSVQLKASGGDFYKWEPPDGIDRPDAPDPWAKPFVSTKYVVHVTRADGLTDTDTVIVYVRPWPYVNAGIDIEACVGEEVELSAEGDGELFWFQLDWAAVATVSGPIVTLDTTTTFVVVVLNADGCRGFDDVTVFISEPPVANAGTNRVFVSRFEARMGATLETGETGTWKVESGSGIFENPNGPNTRITGLELGDNVFSWTVTNQVCPESVDYVLIRVKDFLVPNVITPNGDGKNDRFHIFGIERFEKSELVILDRWGEEVFREAPYMNNWDGITQNGNELPEDTYYYILKFTEDDIRKGFIMIVR